MSGVSKQYQRFCSDTPSYKHANVISERYLTESIWEDIFYFFIYRSKPCSIFILSCCKVIIHWGHFWIIFRKNFKIFQFEFVHYKGFLFTWPFEAPCLTHVSLVQYLLCIINLQYLHSCQKFRPRWLDNLTGIQFWCFK